MEQNFSILAVICAIVLVFFDYVETISSCLYKQIRNSKSKFLKVMKSPAIWALCLIMITLICPSIRIIHGVMYMQDYIKVPN